MEARHDSTQPQGNRRRRIWISLGIVFALLIVFHRPLLLSAIHWFVVRQAAKEHIHLDFRAEGNVFNALTIRNLHAFPTGPSSVESADADYLRIEYDLFALLRGRSDFLDAIELRNARVVINPAQVRVKVAPRPAEKVTLPAVFPDRARLEDVSFVMRDPAHDLVVDHASIELNPRVESTLSATLLQLPSGEAWKNISGHTSYRNRDLVLTDVVLNDRTRIKLLNVDASHIEDHTLAFKLDATLDGAPLEAAATMTEEARSLRVSSHLETRNLAIASAKKLGVLSTFYTDGTVENLTADFGGLLSSPRTWTSDGHGSLRDLRIGGFTLDRGTLQFSAHNGVATIAPVTVTQGTTGISLNGTIQLPEEASELGHAPMKFEIVGDQLDLAPMTASMPEPLSGAGSVHAQLEVRDEQLTSEIEVRGDAIGNRIATIQHLEGTISGRKDLRLVKESEPWFHGVIGQGRFLVRDIRSGDFAAETIDVQLSQRGGAIRLDGTVRGGEGAEVSLGGEASLLDDPADFQHQPATLRLTVNCPNLSGFANAGARDRIAGSLQGEADLHWDGEHANGSFNLYGANVRVEDLQVANLSAAATVFQNKVFLNDFTAQLDARDFVRAHGTVDLTGKREFSGSVIASLADASTLKPILGRDLGGALELNWEGHGTFRKIIDTGALKLTLKNGRFGEMKALHANVDAKYSPDGLDVPIVYIGSDQMSMQTSVSAKGDTLSVSKIEIDQGASKYAVGNAEIPFRWGNIGTDAPLFPRDGKVNVSFVSENLDLKKLFDDFGVAPLATGAISLKVQADGTLENLRAHADIDARDLRNPKFTNIEPATLQMTLDAANGKLSATGQLKQPRLQPIDLSANVPFDAGKVLRDGFDENTPIDARVRLPRSSINFVRQFVPAIQQLDGDATIDVTVNGTVAHPILGGSGDVTVNVARLDNDSVPPLRGLKSRLTFRDNTLYLERVSGDLAGGPFNAGGRVVFQKLTDPVLDLNLHADSILIARNDSMTARANADLRISGPLASATVTGKVALTNSHFLKDIDLIPIGLPGRPAPPPVDDRPDFSLPDPPLRDWKFDVAVTTKDPFLIRGNLANGGAVVDVHLGGTGLHPELKGNVRLQNVEATLPFSRLEVTNGFLYFDPSDSFNPKIDLQGISVVRDYTVRVYVYGRALSPQAIFTSEPPLPQEEIISLLATGATRQELEGNGNVLAGRAAMLVVQQLYRKIFKNGAPVQSNPVFDRLSIDLGGVDPRTGQQQATARFKVNNNWVLVGDLGVGGDFRGQVKYLIRFH